MHRRPSRAGFTLIELLVVIAVIGMLAAILFPVFGRAKEKARQTKCKANLMQLVTALKEFRTNEGHYPPGPYYDPPTGRYHGGFSDLYPNYITDLDVFICPDDSEARENAQECRDRVYCSYNGLVDWSTGHFRTLTSGGTAILYNCYGYTYQYKLDPADPEHINEVAADNGWSSGYDTEQAGCILPPGMPAWMDIYLDDGTAGANGIPDFLDVARLSWQHFPGLVNRSAPDYTIVTHCPHHREYYDSPTREMDIIVTLGGQTSLGNITDLGNPTVTGVPDGSTSAVAGWVHQNF